MFSLSMRCDKASSYFARISVRRSCASPTDFQSGISTSAESLTVQQSVRAGLPSIHAAADPCTTTIGTPSSEGRGNQRLGLICTRLDAPLSLHAGAASIGSPPSDESYPSPPSRAAHDPGPRRRAFGAKVATTLL